MDVTVAEVARGLASLEDRVDRERAEMLTEVRNGFAQLQKAITAQSSERITKDVYTADQRRFELELKRVHHELESLRKLVIGSFLAVIAVGLYMAVTSGLLGA